MNNPQKICFIICTNNSQYLQECLTYLNFLNVPNNFDVEILTITDAVSMCSGYNEAMNSSNAKYKVYLHQDTFIIQKDFIQKILDIFSADEKIGIIGMVGAPELSKDGVMWHKKRCGDFYRLDMFIEQGVDSIEPLKQGIKEVEVVDGFLIATQYDIPWREDILKEWDFYDVAQCLDFRREGYKIVVPAQNPSWTIHACGIPGYWNYNKNREIVLQEYPEIEKKTNQLRILFCNSNEISIPGLAVSLTNLGHCVEVAKHIVNLDAFSLHDVEMIEEELEEGHYDLVVSYNMCMGIAAACDKMKVKYFAWIYDNPFLQLYTDFAKSPYVYINVFDKLQYKRMKEFGLPNILHSPLCAEVDVFGATDITKEDEKKYSVDVAFVGRLYDHRVYEGMFDTDSQELLEEFEKIAKSGDCVWREGFSIFGQMSEKLSDKILSTIEEDAWKIYQIDKQYYCESMKVAGKCNNVERIKILNCIAAKYQMVLYSDDSAKDMLNGVTIRPWVDYWGEMPKVFHLSRININITSRSIESGIPQRVFDIMAVGGFCLTNYQPELEDLFEIGKDLDVYHDLDELMKKIEYYLSHERERVRIAMNGYKKVREYHNYDCRMKKILNWIFEEKYENTLLSI